MMNAQSSSSQARGSDGRRSRQARRSSPQPPGPTAPRSTERSVCWMPQGPKTCTQDAGAARRAVVIFNRGRQVLDSNNHEHDDDDDGCGGASRAARTQPTDSPAAVHFASRLSPLPQSQPSPMHPLHPCHVGVQGRGAFETLAIARRWVLGGGAVSNGRNGRRW